MGLRCCYLFRPFFKKKKHHRAWIDFNFGSAVYIDVRTCDDVDTDGIDERKKKEMKDCNCCEYCLMVVK